MPRPTTKQLDRLVETVRMGRVPKMSHVTDTTLLAYVIAYLQEEQQRAIDFPGLEDDSGAAYTPEWMRHIISQAIDAYAGGAR